VGSEALDRIPPFHVALFLWTRLREHEAGENGFKLQSVLGESKVDEAVMISRILPPLKIGGKVNEVDVIDKAILGE